MSIGRFLVSLVIVSNALVLAAPASAAPRTEGAARAASLRDRKLADAKVALKGDAQRAARENFNGRVNYLNYTTGIKDLRNIDRVSGDALKSFTENSGTRTLAVQANRLTVHSALETQATVTAKALVQAVGPERAKSHTAKMVSTTKAYVAENSFYHSRRDLGHAYRLQRAVNNVIALGVKKDR